MIRKVLFRGYCVGTIWVLNPEDTGQRHKKYEEECPKIQELENVNGYYKTLQFQQGSAHNPEVVGSSPSPATKRKPTDFNGQRVFVLSGKVSDLYSLGTIWVLFRIFYSSRIDSMLDSHRSKEFKLLSLI